MLHTCTVYTGTLVQFTSLIWNPGCVGMDFYSRYYLECELYEVSNIMATWT